jgi:hypothetical protein
MSRRSVFASPFLTLWFSEASVRASRSNRAQTFAIVCESLRQDFNRDVALELRVPCAIHLAL